MLCEFLGGQERGSLERSRLFGIVWDSGFVFRKAFRMVLYVCTKKVGQLLELRCSNNLVRRQRIF